MSTNHRWQVVFAAIVVIVCCQVGNLTSVQRLIGAAIADTGQVESYDDRKVEFNMNGRPCGDVFERLSDETNLPVVKLSGPFGLFKFCVPQDYRYTIPQVIGFIDHAMKLEGYTLIRRCGAFVVWPINEPVCPGDVTFP